MFESLPLTLFKWIVTRGIDRNERNVRILVVGPRLAVISIVFVVCNRVINNKLMIKATLPKAIARAIKKNKIAFVRFCVINARLRNEKMKVMNIKPNTKVTSALFRFIFMKTGDFPRNKITIVQISK